MSPRNKKHSRMVLHLLASDAHKNGESLHAWMESVKARRPELTESIGAVELTHLAALVWRRG